jgi:hypothetical protein
VLSRRTIKPTRCLVGPPGSGKTAPSGSSERLREAWEEHSDISWHQTLLRVLVEKIVHPAVRGRNRFDPAGTRSSGEPRQQRPALLGQRLVERATSRARALARTTRCTPFSACATKPRRSCDVKASSIAARHCAASRCVLGLPALARGPRRWRLADGRLVHGSGTRPQPHPSP